MKKIIFFLVIISLYSCDQNKEKIKILQKRIDSLENNLQCCKNCEYQSQSILWYQHSPEMRALYIQSYNVAKKTLDYNFDHKMNNDKKSAVVLDIDETILNNSPYQGWQYISDKNYSDSTWNLWVKDTIAKPLPGVVDFLNYAKDLGCEIFYVSNREDVLFKPTLKNLQDYKLPCADKEHLLLKSKSDVTPEGKTTKEKRRLYIENKLNFEILLLCGDQMADFDKAFDLRKDGTENQITDSVNKYKEDFGSKFIIIPNPMYGDWLSQIIYGNNKNYSCSHLDSLRRNKTISWKH